MRRPVRDNDDEFLWQLHVAGMGSYVEATWGWDEDEQRELRVGANARAREGTRILELEGRAIGSLFIEELPDAVALRRIVLLPEYQNRGIGSMLIRELIEAADRRGLPVRLRVLRVNPVRALYERMGFSVVGELPEHLEMERPTGG